MSLTWVIRHAMVPDTTVRLRAWCHFSGDRAGDDNDLDQREPDPTRAERGYLAPASHERRTYDHPPWYVNYGC
jgi:hypothetical protein